MTIDTKKTADYIRSLNPREAYPHYVGGDLESRQQMLESLGLSQLNELYSHLPPEVIFGQTSHFDHHSHEEIIKIMSNLARKNKLMTSFIGDGLNTYKIPHVVGEIAGVRGLATAYTPYQPERSQGTLVSLWIYQSLMSELTGIEAINASFYERSTCLYEALTCSTRLTKSNKVLVSSAIYEGDLAVLRTYAEHTPMELEVFDVCPRTGAIELDKLESVLSQEHYACFAFSQINSFGNIENVDAITDLTHSKKSKLIAIFDPMTISSTGLKAPVEYGQRGADMIVAEAQSLCLEPNFGGPGLGLFGIRYNDSDKRSIRQSAGRFIGKTIDIKGQECLSLILSTREQHIRREKATSNICSNQSFVASLAGAGVLSRGSAGLNKIATDVKETALRLAQELISLDGIELAYPNQVFFNEFIIKLKTLSSKTVLGLIQAGLDQSLEIGVNYSHQCQFEALKISVTDRHSTQDIEAITNFFKSHFSIDSSLASDQSSRKFNKIPESCLRQIPLEIPKVNDGELLNYYNKLGALNLSPDDAIYPLGSCTMKYNPYLNEWAAALKGFTSLHPQAPIKNSQGALELLYEIQNMFVKITGLKALTTQPVAGAQGELVGIKMFQAYHKAKGESEQRKYILIPQTAHGTNPATATMAGYIKKEHGGGILPVKASPAGEIDLQQIKEYIKQYGPEISGIMVTNPNTAGIFESQFHKMAKLIHEIGGLVYMDGANMNAIAGWVNLGAMGVDAVHNNLHKTWSIPHGGGGPGDAIVAVSHRLEPYLPGSQIIKKKDGTFDFKKTSNSIGSFHRHHGNFAHKVRCMTYLLSLGSEGTRLMSAYSVLSSRYLYSQLKDTYQSLPKGADDSTRMHEFILTLSQDDFRRFEVVGLKKTDVIPRMGKLFLDFGFHAPTVAFPETFGLMLEPTESFSKDELKQFAQTVKAIFQFATQNPSVLLGVPYFAPTSRVDELYANRKITLKEKILSLPNLPEDKTKASYLRALPLDELCAKILAASTHSQGNQVLATEATNNRNSL